MLGKNTLAIITGASGLLGSELSRLLPNSLGVSSSNIDLTSPAACTLLSKMIEEAKHENDDIVIIHCAARVGGVKANTDRVADFYYDNSRMNMNVLEAARKTRSKLVSVMSTCIYPDQPHVVYPMTEDQLHMGPPHFSNFGYAYAKRMLDVQSRAYRRQFGSRFVSVIPNNLYGLNDNYDLESAHVIPALIRKFYEAKTFGANNVVLWGSGNPLREFTFARDAARIIAWVAENYEGEDPVNIGCTNEVSIIDLAEKIRGIVGFNGEIIWDVTKPEGQFRKPTSNKRLIDIGWRGCYTPLDDGLQETIQHFKACYPLLRGL